MSIFSKIAADGSTLPVDATEWVAVLDSTTGLLWSAGNLGDKELNWQDAAKACSEFALCGYSDWRMPTVEELFCLADRSRYNPAIDTDFFPSTKSDWYWSSTPGASSPSGFAWGVDFDYGLSGYGGQSYTALVRPVRSASSARQ